MRPGHRKIPPPRDKILAAAAFLLSAARQLNFVIGNTCCLETMATANIFQELNENLFFFVLFKKEFAFLFKFFFHIFIIVIVAARLPA